jgi:hypothetical protein
LAQSVWDGVIILIKKQQVLGWSSARRGVPHSLGQADKQVDKQAAGLRQRERTDPKPVSSWNAKVV